MYDMWNEAIYVHCIHAHIQLVNVLGAAEIHFVICS